ncbi:MAG TPA: hypothetical protein DIT64_13130 [Verrucomicrobiales bacterium]|nr:hypothetical protein [Verrucomicrobiales bacterium]HCN77984.1 hypothetical protein [Verrucomicrobiales bacterium]
MRSVCFSPDGRWLAVSSMDKTVQGLKWQRVKMSARPSLALP